MKRLISLFLFVCVILPAQVTTVGGTGKTRVGGTGTTKVSASANVPISETNHTVFFSTASSASHVVTFGFTATAGRLLKLHVASDATVTTPAGYSLAPPVGLVVGDIGQYDFFKVAAGGETSVTLVPSVSDCMVCVVLEIAGTVSSPQDTGATGSTSGNVASLVTAGPTATLAKANEYVVAATAWHSDLDPETVSSWTGGPTQIYTATSTGSSPNNVAITVASQIVNVVTAKTVTANFTTASGNMQYASLIVSTWKGN